MRGRRCRGGRAPPGRGARRARPGAGPRPCPGPGGTHRRVRSAGRPERERASRGGARRRGDSGDRAGRCADPRVDTGAGAGGAPGVVPAAALDPRRGGRPAGPGARWGEGRRPAPSGRGHATTRDRRPRYRPADRRAAAGRAARGHRRAGPRRQGPAARAGGRGHLPGGARSARGVPRYRPAAPAGRLRVQPDRGALPAHRRPEPRAAGRAGRPRAAPGALAPDDGPVRGGADPGLRGGVPSRAQRAAGGGLRLGHPAGHRHRAAPVADPRAGRRSPAPGALRPLAGPQLRIPPLRPGHRGPADARSTVERGPAGAGDAAAPGRRAGRRGRRPGGVRPGRRSPVGPGEPGGGAVQSAGGAGRGPRDRPGVRRAGGGSAEPAGGRAARMVRGGARRVDRRRGPGRRATARGGAGLARRGGGRVAARRRHLGGGGAGHAVRAPAMARLRPGRGAAHRRTEAATGHSYDQRLATAGLGLRAVRGRPGGCRRPLRRTGHGRGGGRGPRARAGGRVPEGTGRGAGSPGPADALSR